MITLRTPSTNHLPRRTSTRPGAADIIGDVHGHAEELYDLLDGLGYRRSTGSWRHPEHRLAVFTGDLIDHGPDPRGVLRTVSDMILAGSARCVMGNHEFHALLHHRKQADGTPLRSMTGRQLASHEPTLRTLARQYPDEWRGWLKWMHSLPLWYDAGTFRVVHACWDRAARTFLIRPGLDDNLLAACALDGPERQFVETLLKGPTLSVSFGMEQAHTVRLRWWDALPANATLKDAAVDELPAELAELPVPPQAHFTPYHSEAPPLFVGHYNITGDSPQHLAPNVICVDAGVARGGRLAAWRLNHLNRLPDFAA